MEESDMKIMEFKEKLDEAETMIGNGSESEARNLQEKGWEIIKVQETVKEIESKLSSIQVQIIEEAKQMTATYADVSKVKETKTEKSIITKEVIKTQFVEMVKKK